MIDRSITLNAEPTVPGDEAPSYDLDITYMPGFGWIVWQDGEQWNDGEPFRTRQEAADEIAHVLGLPRHILRRRWLK